MFTKSVDSEPRVWPGALGHRQLLYKPGGVVFKDDLTSLEKGMSVKVAAQWWVVLVHELIHGQEDGEAMPWRSVVMMVGLMCFQWWMTAKTPPWPELPAGASCYIIQERQCSDDVTETRCIQRQPTKRELQHCNMGEIKLLTRCCGGWGPRRIIVMLAGAVELLTLSSCALVNLCIVMDAGGVSPVLGNSSNYCYWAINSNIQSKQSFDFPCLHLLVCWSWWGIQSPLWKQLSCPVDPFHVGGSQQCGCGLNGKAVHN